jgi:hypothetical protein
VNKDVFMKNRLIYLFVFIITCSFSAGWKGEMRMEKKHVVLLGASVGREWHIESLPERLKDQDYDFEYVGFSGFDKSKTLTEILSRKENKPDIVFLKECAAYFPGDLEHYKELMKRWITMCQQEDVVPIPTTAVPVTRLHALKKFMIDIVKGRNPLRQGNPLKHNRNASIIAYNDWIKEYAKEQGLAVLDMEAAVRYSETNRFLREDMAKIDGLHVNSLAYKSLDKIVIPALESAEEPK